MRGIDTNICEAFEITAGDRLADVKRPAASVILNILSARRIVLTELCKVHLPQPEDTVVSEHFNCHLPVTQELLRSDSCGYIRVGENLPWPRELSRAVTDQSKTMMISCFFGVVETDQQPHFRTKSDVFKIPEWVTETRTNRSVVISSLGQIM